LYSERRLFLDGPKVPVLCTENIFTQACIILYDPILVKEFMVTQNHHHMKVKFC
jgi:hypothetical protein